MNKTQPARGMRDFLPSEIRKRNYVINIIKEVYESYGFEPLETPAVENLETLTGKYGEEGNQLMFKILKRGEKLQEELTEGKIKSEKDLSDLALRYDLTVPLARVIANYKNELPRFFKRYQIQPVWRADRPARGRFREFYQCDVDAIGSKSMLVEAELISAVCEILERLGFEDFEILVNHRNLLTGILESVEIPVEKHSAALTALDKLDKIGREGIEKEFLQKGIVDESGFKLLNIFEVAEKVSRLKNRIVEFSDFVNELEQSFDKKLQPQKHLWEIYSGEKVPLIYPTEEQIQKAQVDHDYFNLNIKHNLLNILALGITAEFIEENNVGMDGVRETKGVLGLLGNNTKIRVSPTLARGLSYYTGAIFEVVLTKGDFAGSIGGGGRYDGLIGMFGKEEIPACGFSLGLERILVVMNERGMFPPELETNSADVLVTIMNEESAAESLILAGELRKENLRVLVYPEADKLGKQFKYADSVGAKYVCVLGEMELAENKVTVKNLQTGEQETVEREAVGNLIVGKARQN